LGTKIASSISYDGAFFRKDPGKTFRQNIRVLMAAVAEEGRKDVQAQLDAGEASREPVSSGVQPARVSDHVVGRVKSLTGRQWAVTANVSVLNQNMTPKQARALMAAAASLEKRNHAFRRTATRLRKARALNTVELLKGIK
jgi:hypothetical protein